MLALVDSLSPPSRPELELDLPSSDETETVHAEAKLQRRGRALCFVETRVVTDDGTAIAAATAVVRARDAGEGNPLPTTSGCEGATPGPLAAVLEKAPFMHRLGMKIEHMDEGRARVSMAASEQILGDDGAVHDGAMLALLDTTGAMAA